MKNPRTLNTDYDAWLKRFQYETLKNLYKRWDAVMAGAEIGNLDLIEDKNSVYYFKAKTILEKKRKKVSNNRLHPEG